MLKPIPVPIWEIPKLHYHHFGDREDSPPLSAFSNLFQINKLEDSRDKIRFPLPPHKKEAYDFLFITKGQNIRSKALTNYEFGANTFFFLPAFQITHHEFMSQDTEGYYCHFNMDIFNSFFPQHNILRDFSFLQFNSYPLVEVAPQISAFLVTILQRLELEYLRGKETDFTIITAYLFVLFIEVNRFYLGSSFTKNNTAATLTQKFKDALTQYIYEKQRVSEYAELLNVTPNYLNKCVKKTMNISAQELLFQIILLEAKVLLKQTDMSIGEIAYKLTKQDHSSFSRFFKTHTGMTPKEYANKTDFVQI